MPVIRTTKTSNYTKDIDQFYTDLMTTPAVLRKGHKDTGKTVGPSVIEKLNRTMKAAFNYAVKQGYILYNPVLAATIPEYEKTEVVVWEPEEAKRALDTCQDKSRSAKTISPGAGATGEIHPAPGAEQSAEYGRKGQYHFGRGGRDGGVGKREVSSQVTGHNIRHSSYVRKYNKHRLWTPKGNSAGAYPLQPLRMEESMRTRNNRIFLRLNDGELEKLNSAVRRSGLSREVYLRQLIAGIQPRDLPPPDFRPMMRQLYYCGNNLNQIARKANALNIIDVQKYDEAVCEFRRIVKVLNEAVLEPEGQNK